MTDACVTSHVHRHYTTSQTITCRAVRIELFHGYSTRVLYTDTGSGY